ncbi:MAG TPA: flagellar hook capping FlgD N-terminal domain-containing protein [Ideonella sp.]|nr:flagellar hook capping FlgD N-terminal domain-containing protein [Ideonella sp.]
MAVSGVADTTSTAADSLSSSAATSQELSDRFLKLLVAQMQNQDPLNPLDNAEVTSQMAQISTVTGLDTLNTTVGGLNSQFVQMQAMQGAALVGRDVAVEGDDLRITEGVADGGFELSATADTVKIEITSPSGTVLDTIEMTNLEAGRHSFNWTVPEAYAGTATNFKITATAGTTAVESMALEHQRINAVSSFGDTLALELADGERVAYSAVWAFL